MIFDFLNFKIYSITPRDMRLAVSSYRLVETRIEMTL